MVGLSLTSTSPMLAPMLAYLWRHLNLILARAGISGRCSRAMARSPLCRPIIKGRIGSFTSKNCSKIAYQE